MELREEKTPKSLLTLNPPLLAKDLAMVLHTMSPSSLSLPAGETSSSTGPVRGCWLCHSTRNYCSHDLLSSATQASAQFSSSACKRPWGSRAADGKYTDNPRTCLQLEEMPNQGQENPLQNGLTIFFFLPEKPCYPLPIHHHLPCTKQNPDLGVSPPWLPSLHRVFKYFIPHIHAVHMKT